MQRILLYLTLLRGTFSLLSFLKEASKEMYAQRKNCGSFAMMVFVKGWECPLGGHTKIEMCPQTSPVSNLTERRGRVVNIPASYSGIPGSNLGPETGYPDSGLKVISLVLPGKRRYSRPALN
jgi:hypothetical protein